MGASRSVVSYLPVFAAACSSVTRWKLRGLILQFGDSSGKILLQKAGIVSFHCCSALVWPGSLNGSAHTCATCTASPATWRKCSNNNHLTQKPERSLLQRPHFHFFQLHYASGASLGGSVSARQFLEGTIQTPSLFPPLYTPQLNMRAAAEPFPAWRQGSMVWNMDKDLLGEEGREPYSSYKKQSYSNLTVQSSQRLHCSTQRRLKSSFSAMKIKYSTYSFIWLLRK